MKILAKILRAVCFHLVTNKMFYLIGMVLVRFGRKLRKAYYKRNGIKSSKQQITAFNSIKMEVDLATYMGGSIFWFGMHHVNEIVFLNKYLKSNYTFIDVGANQGEFSLFAASKLVNGRVISFEPVKKQLEMLKVNIALNHFENITVNTYGLSEELGELPIYTSLDSTAHHGIHEGLSSLFPSDTINSQEQVIPLKVFDDEYFTQLDRFDVLKIDIEGAELFAMKGMSKSLKKFKPLILIEINDATFESAGYNTGDVLDFLSNMGYKPFRIYRGALKQIGKNDFADYGNYVFIAN